MLMGVNIQTPDGFGGGDPMATDPPPAAAKPPPKKAPRPNAKVVTVGGRRPISPPGGSQGSGCARAEASKCERQEPEPEPEPLSPEEEARRAKKKEADAHKDAGNAAYKAKKFDEAIDSYKKARAAVTRARARAARRPPPSRAHPVSAPGLGGPSVGGAPARSPLPALLARPAATRRCGRTGDRGLAGRDHLLQQHGGRQVRARLPPPPRTPPRRDTAPPAAPCRFAPQV
jgi:hypothetical protein